MAIRVMNALERGRETLKREVIHNTPKLHTWIHVYPKPGDKDDMHCHNADQTFYVMDGKCTMHFPGGNNEVMTPGMIALIHGGDFYQLENTGDGPMILIGNRSGPSGVKHINYETRQDLNAMSAEEKEKIRDARRTQDSK